MKTKNVLITLGVIALLVLGVVFPRGNSVVQQIVGAQAGPDSYSPYNSFNGVTFWSNRVAVITASSTLCSIKTPAATSTIVSASVVLNTTASYATQYLLGADSTAYSTTTSLGGVMGVDANKKLVYVASSTVNDNFTGTTNYGAVPPSTYINFKLSTTTEGASATYAPAGFCTVVFQEL